jgi:septal ring factor EnvC (AmiA/AmiB activator)
MRLRALWLCTALSGVLVGGSAPAATEEIVARQLQVERERTELRARIQLLQKELDEREAKRQEAADALQVSETAISVSTRRLAELGTQLRQAQSDLEDLQSQLKRQQTLLTTRRDELSDQLRKQYSSGCHPGPHFCRAMIRSS